MRLVQRATEHPVSVLMVFAAILTFGLVSFSQLPQELLPGIPVPTAQVITEYAGLPAPEMEALITVPVENALSSVKAVRSLASVSMDGLSSVRIEFDWGVDQNRAAVQVREKIDSLYPFLPNGSAKPLVVTAAGTSDRPLITLAVVPEGKRGIGDISNVVSGELSSRLQQVPGIATLRIVGLAEPEIKVDVDAGKLATAGVPLQQVARVIASSIYSAPLGTVVEGQREYLVEATTDVSSLEEIRRIPVAGFGAVRVGEFARVYWGLKERTSFFHHNGKEAIGIFLEKTPGSGSLNTARNLRTALAVLGPLFAGDLEIQIIDDPTEEIEAGIGGLLLAIILGCAAVCLVVLLMFRRVAVSIVIAAAIPASVMIVFLFMKFAGIGLNLVSLSGIAIGIGMIVDNSIVVVDSLLRARAKDPEGIAVAAGTTLTAIVGSTATTLLVFLPVVFIPGTIGVLFRDLALTVCCLLIASLVCALTLTPALYRLLLGRRVLRLRGVRWMGISRRIYSNYLQRELVRPVVTPVLTGILLLAGFLAAVVLPKQILPETELRTLHVRVEFPPVAPIESCRSASEGIATRLLAIERVGSVYVSAGYDRDSLSDRGDPERDPRRVHFTLDLSPAAKRLSAQVAAEVEEVLEGFPDIRYSVSGPTDSFHRLLGDTEVVQYRLSGGDRELLVEAATRLSEQLAGNRLIRAAWIDTRREAKRIEFNLNLPSLASQRVDPAVILESLRTAVRGSVGSQLSADGIRTDIRVRLDPEVTAGGSRLGAIRVPVEDELVEAGLFGTFEQVRSYHQLYRFNRRPAVLLTVLPLPGTRNEVTEFLAAQQNERGEVLTVSALRRNQRHIFTVFAFALLLMYLLIGAQLESFVLPLLLLATLIPALCGSLIVLLLCGYSLNVNSFLGILILIGTAINISIILTAGLEEGMPISRRRLVFVCGNRTRPIAATVLSTVIAVIPIAVNSSGQAALQSNTAVALLGGLLIGVISILLVYPVLYDRIVCVHRRRRQ